MTRSISHTRSPWRDRFRWVEPQRVVLALSSEPQKTTSRERFRPADQNDIIALLDSQASRVGPKGIFIADIATHAFVAGGQLYLLASGSLRRRPESSLTTTTLFDIVSGSAAPRSVIFIDACREQVSADHRGPKTPDATPLLKSMARANGQVVFYGAAPGRYAYADDQRQNGVFTAALLGRPALFGGGG